MEGIEKRRKLPRKIKVKTSIPAKDQLYAALFSANVKVKPAYWVEDSNGRTFLRGIDIKDGGTYLVDLSKLKKAVIDELKETMQPASSCYQNKKGDKKDG